VSMKEGKKRTSTKRSRTSAVTVSFFF